MMFRYRKGHTYTKKLFIVYLKIKVIWVSCNPTNNTWNTSPSRKWGFILPNPFKVPLCFRIHFPELREKGKNSNTVVEPSGQPDINQVIKVCITRDVTWVSPIP